MFPTQSGILKAIDKNPNWSEWIENGFDIPGIYLGLMVLSLRRRGYIRPAWRGGYRLTKAGRAYLLVSINN